jgi:hypothetical protein
MPVIRDAADAPGALPGSGIQALNVAVLIIVGAAGLTTQRKVWHRHATRPHPAASPVTAAATHRADPAWIFPFGLYILFGTKGRARAGVRPCTRRPDGRNLPVSGRDSRPRTRMTWGKDADGLQREWHRRR